MSRAAPRPTVAVAGTGFGLRVHVPALRLAGFDVVALVGTDPGRTARRAARLGIARAATSLDEVLAEGVDAVTIATPPHTHHDLFHRAVAAGCHVICEKPLGLTPAEAGSMVAAASAAGVVALMGNEFRWDPAVDAVRGAIHDGAIGDPRTATLVRAYPILADPAAGAPDWWFDAARGGGWLGANGSHLIDQLRSWFGEIAEVEGWLSAARRTPDDGSDRPVADDGYQFRFTTSGGAVGMVQETAAAWGDPVEVTRVVGSAGTAWIEGGDAWIATEAGTRRLEPRIGPGATAGTVADDPRPWTGREIAAYGQLAAAFAARIAGREPDGPAPPTVADGAAVVAVIDAVRRSHAEGRRVVVPSTSRSCDASSRPSPQEDP